MKFLMYVVLIAMEYCLLKIALVVINALIIGGVAEFLGYVTVFFVALIGVALWRHGVRQIRG